MAKRKILIVDDEASVRALLVSALRAPANETVEAENGAQALELAAQHGYFDLIVTDIMMPGITGTELAQRLRRGRHARRFLFITGFAQGDALERALEEFDRAELLAKPFSISDLLRAVSRLCEQAPASLAVESLQRPAGA
jgi:CheY-like chemotaxis protein